ncbi:AAA family ATPase [Haliangium sp.]|uniref:AAA family ATPase n=1 Tax=Haliangium sp. TaxID=2663208 RepID=UPI003D10AD2A
MRILSLQLTNIRCFQSLVLDFDRDLTLIFGPNGAGKSTVIDAIAAALSAVPGMDRQAAMDEHALRVDTVGAPFQRERARAGEVRVTLHNEGRERALGIRLERGEGATPTGNHEGLAEAIQTWVDDPERILPVLAVYTAQRSWRDLAPPTEPPIGRRAGYVDALSAGADLAHLRAWWRDQELERLRRSEMPALAAAKEAVRRLLGDEVALPVYSAVDGDIIVEVPETRARLCLRELSGGYRGMVALVIDIARRMAQLNPALGAEVLQRTPGVVAVDVLEPHLHPTWQRLLLPRLRALFPQVQWIATTHSPQVLAGVDENSEVVGLSLSGEVEDGVLPVVGRDSNAVLVEVMGDRERPAQYEAKLDELYQKLDEQDFERVRVIIRELAAVWGADEPTLVRARWALDVEED